MSPLHFQPIIKRIRWGGRRLGTLLHKSIGDHSDYAESWEIVDHGDDQSVVTSGPYQGWSLSRLMRECNGELLGRHRGVSQFPLLAKFLDANDTLSVQVHPNDEQARRYDPRENGKTEAWVILDAQPDSRLYAGLKQEISRHDLEQQIAAGTIEDCLHSFPVQPGDCVFIPAGTVHAIGAGILLAEIQQSSDLTFRLYDWGRVGNDGQPRELHIVEALACINFDRGPVNPVRPQLISEGPNRIEELVRSDYFVMRRHTLRKAWVRSNDDRFRILMTLNGQATVSCGDERWKLSLGQTVLLPATAPDIQIVPANEVTLLETFLP